MTSFNKGSLNGPIYCIMFMFVCVMDDSNKICSRPGEQNHYDRINNLHLVKSLVAFGSQTTWSGGANGETLEFY